MISNVLIVGLLELQCYSIVLLCRFVIMKSRLVNESTMKMVKWLEIECLEIERLFTERKC